MRQTAEEIDQAILDTAAGIFATYGFGHTSVQQVADAVGYSKPGLLHRFGSKEALYRAVLAMASGEVARIAGEAARHDAGADRLPRALTLLAEEAMRRPGMVRIMLRAYDAAPEEPYADEVTALGRRVLELLDRPLDTQAERLRAVLGLRLLVNAAQAQHLAVETEMLLPPQTLVPLVVELASHVIGPEAC